MEDRCECHAWEKHSPRAHVRVRYLAHKCRYTCTCTCLHRTAPYRTAPHRTASVHPSVRPSGPSIRSNPVAHSVSIVRPSDPARRSADSFDHWVSVAVSVLRQNTPPRCTAPRCIVTTALTPIDSNSHLLRKESSQGRSGDHGSFAGDGRRRRQAERARRRHARQKTAR